MVKLAHQVEMVKLAYQVEMDEMVVMENLDLVDFQAAAELAMWEQKVTWENRDLLDPGVEESLMSGGVEPPAQTQQELNLFMLDKLLELSFDIPEEQISTCVYQNCLNTKTMHQVCRDSLQYMVLSINPQQINH